jgi:hypothetical protein
MRPECAAWEGHEGDRTSHGGAHRSLRAGHRHRSLTPLKNLHGGFQGLSLLGPVARSLAGPDASSSGGSFAAAAGWGSRSGRVLQAGRARSCLAAAGHCLVPRAGGGTLPCWGWFGYHPGRPARRYRCRAGARPLKSHFGEAIGAILLWLLLPGFQGPGLAEGHILAESGTWCRLKKSSSSRSLPSLPLGEHLTPMRFWWAHRGPLNYARQFSPTRLSQHRIRRFPRVVMPAVPPKPVVRRDVPCGS